MILYLTYDGLTEPLGQSQILPYLIGLSSKGYRIHIISFEKKKRLNEGKQHIQSIIDSNENLSWQPLNYTSKPPLISTAKDIRSLRKTIKHHITNSRIDLIHCRSYPTTFAALKLVRNTNIKLLFDMRGLYIDERFDGNIWNKDNFFWKFLKPRLKKMELRMLNESDAIISLTHNAKKEIESWKGFNNTAIHITPCNADLQHFNKRTNTNKSLTKLVYLGSVGTWYMLDEMLEFYILFSKKYSKSEFHFITLDSPEIIINKARKLDIDLDEIKIYAQDRKDLPETLSKMDIAISFIKPLFSKKASSPTKMGELLSMGIPIICNKGIGDIDQLAKDNAEYIHCIDTSTKAFTKEIDQVQKLLDSRNNSHSNIRAIAKENFSLSDGIEQYKKAYNTLLKTNKK